MRVSSLRFINRLAATWIILFCFLPPFQVADIYRFIAIVASFIWLCTALVIDPKFINGKVANFICVGFLCVGLMFLWRLNVNSPSVAFANIIQPIIMILIALISMYSMKNDTEFLNVVITIILILVCYYCITTIKATYENPYASRIANSDWLEERFKGNENVGLYGYVYMCVFLIPLLLYKIIKGIKINKLADFCSYVALILILVMVLFAGYMIAIVCTIIGIIMILLLNKVSTLRILLVACIGILILAYQQQLVSGLLRLIGQAIGDNPVYNDKLMGFLSLYEGGDMGDSSWNGRFSNYSASFRNVIKYPVVGCYFFGYAGGGGHSTVLDTIGRYGWGTAFLYFTITWKYPRKIVPFIQKKHLLYTVVIVLSLLFGFLDPYCQEMALPWFVVMPYIIYLERKQKFKEV